MEHDKIGLSRRKMLVGLGAMGVASAGAGLGTTAYFSDEEGFTDNTLTAGQLDLMLDYKATYDGPNGPELIGQRPSQEQLTEQYGEGEFEGPLTWEQRADLGFACDTEGLINGNEIPIFELDDVKPGDYGEVTMSFHICDNPAYVWMRGGVYNDDDNGLNEPESLVDETGGEGEGELAENIDVRMWYDSDCSNTYDEEAGKTDILLVQDISGSMEYDQYGGVISDGQGGQTTKLDEAREAAESFCEVVFDETADTHLGVLTFGNENYIGNDYANGVQFTPSGVENDVKAAIDDIQAAPDDVTGTALGLAVQEAQSFLSSNGRSDAQKVMIVLTDGEQFESNVDELAEANAAKSAGTRIVTIDINEPGDGEPQLLRDMAGSTPTSSGDGDGTDYYNSSADDLPTVLPLIYDDILQAIIVGEEVIFEGTLEEFGDAMSGGMRLDPAPLIGSTDANAACFRPGTHCVAFEWSIDTEVDNVIQTDSVEFDFDFHAEQCRHNDGETNPFAGETPEPA
jgi:predicted ribosomally synthesized peptide with SipW-like signal peptide